MIGAKSWKFQLFAAVCTLGACAPTHWSSDGTGDDSGQESLSGALELDGLQLQWSPGSNWEQGACIDLELTNDTGSDLDYWGMELTLSAPVTAWYSEYGAKFSQSDDYLWVGSSSGSLKSGQSSAFQYCAEPAVVPLEILSAEIKKSETTDPDDDDGDDDDGGGTGDDDDGSSDSPVSGSVSDAALAVVYRDDGSSKGGRCLELTVYNLTSESVSGWSISLGMSGRTTLTDYWGIIPLINGSYLTLYPGQGQSAIAGYQSRVGTVCLDPLVVPVTMDATYEGTDGGADDGTGDGTGGGDSSSAGSLQDGNIALLYRTTVESKGGQCVELTVSNLSGTSYSTWSIALTLTKTAQITDYWDLIPLLQATTLSIYPTEGRQTLGAYQSRVGTVCLDPESLPLTLKATVVPTSD